MNICSFRIIFILYNIYNINFNEIKQHKLTLLKQQEDKTACTKCSDNTVLPVKTIMNCSPTGCNYQMNDPNGLGLGVRYQ